MISGIALVYLEKEGKTLEDPVQAAWQHLFELKFVLSLLMTPLVYPLTSLFAQDSATKSITAETKCQLQFYLLVLIAFKSTVAKYYREVYCDGFQIDPVMLKVKELQSKYNLAKTTDEDMAREEEEKKEQKREK